MFYILKSAHWLPCEEWIARGTVVENIHEAYFLVVRREKEKENQNTKLS